MTKNDKHVSCTCLCSMHMLHCAIGLYSKNTSSRIRLLTISRQWQHNIKPSVGLFWSEGLMQLYLCTPMKLDQLITLKEWEHGKGKFWQNWSYGIILISNRVMKIEEVYQITKSKVDINVVAKQALNSRDPYYYSDSYESLALHPSLPLSESWGTSHKGWVWVESHIIVHGSSISEKRSQSLRRVIWSVAVRVGQRHQIHLIDFKLVTVVGFPTPLARLYSNYKLSWKKKNN